jgi:hypothetical protein
VGSIASNPFFTQYSTRSNRSISPDLRGLLKEYVLRLNLRRDSFFSRFFEVPAIKGLFIIAVLPKIEKTDFKNLRFPGEKVITSVAK